MPRSMSHRSIRTGLFWQVGVWQVGVWGVACLLGCNSPSTAEPQSENAENTKNSTVQGIDVEVSLPKTSKAREPIEMKVTLVNKGRLVPTYGDLGDTVECRAEVRDARGKMAPHTLYGDYLFGLENPIERDGYAIVRLEPGTSKSWTCDLNKCYKFKTGDYKLSLLVGLQLPDSDKGILITVKDIPFTVE